MLTLEGRPGRSCDGVRRAPPSGLRRREFLRVGALGGVGLSLPGLIGAQTLRASTVGASPDRTFGRAKHCILLFMWGGPPHQDTFDPKPEASLETRGEFSAIRTNAPGVLIGDHLPLLAQQADKYAIVRTVHHTNGDHIAVSHDALTGNVYHNANPVITAARNDHPHYGAVLGHLQPRDNGLPAYVQLPCVLQSNSGKTIPGQNGGFLGQKFDPFLVDCVPNIEPLRDPEFRGFSPESIRLPGDLATGRLGRRRDLLELVDRRREDLNGLEAVRGLGELYDEAFSLLATPAVREAFDLESVDAARRDRYGRHTFGQGVLLARQLVHAGVPLVTVYWPNGPRRTDIGWDNHINNFRNLKNWQLPPVDRALSALLEDLAADGKLDETLVVWMGEFGRSPAINDRGGRDHWPYCYSAVLAGAGIRGGTVHGESDEMAAYPKSNPVPLVDLGATIFHSLGIDVTTHLVDAFAGRPHPVCRGKPVEGLV